MANKVAIITDSTINLPEGAMEEYNIQTVPLIIHWDGKSYIDRLNSPQKSSTNAWRLRKRCQARLNRAYLRLLRCINPLLTKVTTSSPCHFQPAFLGHSSLLQQPQVSSLLVASKCGYQISLDRLGNDLG